MKNHQPHLSHPKYRADIDGLRAIAVIAVVAFHAFPNLVRGGFIGVDVFFVISGYLISTIIFENLDKGTFSFSEFYARRIRRIFPALLLVLIACFAFGWFTLLADEFKQLGKHIGAGASFISNFILWNKAGYFDNASDTNPLLHLWSLSIEEQFYIVWPLLIWFAWKQKFNLLTVTVAFALTSFLLNLNGIKQDMIATFYSPQTRFWELLSGSLLSWFSLYKNVAISNMKHKVNFWLSRIVCIEKQESDGNLLSNVLAFIGLLLLLYGFWHIHNELSFPGNWALVPILAAVLIITAGSKAWINRIILSNKAAVWLGLISYPLYLWHWPLLSFARIVEGETPSSAIRIAIILLSVALAWLTYKFIERPLRFGKNDKAKVKALVLLMGIVSIFGISLYRLDGLKFRFINKLNYGVNQALSYDKDKDFRRGECFIDVLDKKTSEFSSICGKKINSMPSLFIWGDSHSASLYRGFESYAKTKNYIVHQFTASGCPPILDFYISKRKECINANNFVYKEIQKLKPDTIILGAYWSLYNGTNGWENLDEGKLVATISKLKSIGIKNIVLVGHLPIFEVNQTDLLRKRYISDNVPTRTYSKFKTEANIYDKKIRDIAALMEISFISPLDILCNTNGCLLSVTSDNITPLSFDYGHLTSNGSQFLVSKFFELKLIKFTY
jgi:peptidoglycan/LPS O-acetylase OafA/YrhL